MQPLAKVTNSVEKETRGQKEVKTERSGVGKEESEGLLINISGNNNEVNYYAGGNSL